MLIKVADAGRNRRDRVQIEGAIAVARRLMLQRAVECAYDTGEQRLAVRDEVTLPKAQSREVRRGHVEERQRKPARQGVTGRSCNERLHLAPHQRLQVAPNLAVVRQDTFVETAIDFAERADR